MNTPASRTSLLGLPPELRLHIYDIVASSEISQEAFNVESVRPFAKRFIRRLGKFLGIQLPVASLAMSCSIIANEIRRHIHALPASHRYAEFQFSPNMRFGPDKVYLQRAPCHIGDLTVLKIALDRILVEHPFYYNGSIRFEALASPNFLSRLLSNLISPGCFIGRNARALTEVHIQMNLKIRTRDTQSNQNHDQLVQGVRDEYERVCVADLFSLRDPWVTAPMLRMQITSETWVDYPPVRWNKKYAPQTQQGRLD